MEFSQIIEKIKEEYPVKTAVKINKEDGEVLETMGDGNQLLSDIGAFIGSAGEVIFRKIGKDSPASTIVKSADMNVIIINAGSHYFAINPVKPGDEKKILDKYKEITTVKAEPQSDEVSEFSDLMDIASNMEENLLGDIERKLLNAKVTQMNFLIEEFAAGGDKDKWLVQMMDSVGTMEDFSKALDIADEIKIKEIVPVAISKDEIAVNSKTLIDALCKAAVEEFGAAEAKKKVQNVILKLNKK